MNISLPPIRGVVEAPLPTLGSKPLASFELNNLSLNASLRRWSLPALILPPGYVSHFLLSFKEKEGIKGGQTFLWWRDIAFLALKLIGRGAYIPSVEFLNIAVSKAIWRPLLEEPDQETLNTLQASMPKTCEQPGLSKPLAELFLEEMLNEFIRKQLSENPIVSLNKQSYPNDFSLEWLQQLSREEHNHPNQLLPNSFVKANETIQAFNNVRPRKS